MKRYIFLPADVVVPINVTWVEGTDFTSEKISLRGIWSAAITVYAKGTHASCSLALDFVFVTWDSLRAMWDTVAYQTVSIFLNGTAAAQKSVAFDPCVEKVKLLSIHNPEVTTGYTATANASLNAHLV
jgi:hypothetical protein